VTYKTGFGLDLLHLVHSHSLGLQAIQSYHYSTHFQFTVTHALGFSVFPSRIQVTDLSQSNCNFKSHMKSSFHRLIPFLPLFCSCQFRRLDPIQFFCSQAHILSGWRPETRLFTSLLKRPSLSLYNTSARAPRKTPSFTVKEACLQLRCLSTDILLFRAFAYTGMCLPSRFLAMGIHSKYFSCK
jgi:hypothetical protein